MKIDAHNPDLPFAALYGFGLHANKNQPQSQAAHQQHIDKAHGQDNAESSSVKAVEASGSTREDQALRKESDYSLQEKQVLDQMKVRDREVRAHEAAHKSAAGSLSHGGAQFSYDTGPDGKRYAVGGEVSIDTSEVPGNPQATIVKAQIIRRAAMAPAQPSSQDRSVAAMATQMEAEARQELSQQKLEEQNPAGHDQQPKTRENQASDSASNQASKIESIVTSMMPTPVGELLNASV